ncbi:hypothetical protein HK101_001049 [Irineochytrium annulatum]|nr:hypothetical protein HK101_001049 [Irineochytrium annulatum]
MDVDQSRAPGYAPQFARPVVNFSDRPPIAPPPPTIFTASTRPHPFEVLGRLPLRRRNDDSPSAASHLSPERRTEFDWTRGRDRGPEDEERDSTLDSPRRRRLRTPDRKTCENERDRDDERTMEEDRRPDSCDRDGRRAGNGPSTVACNTNESIGAGEYAALGGGYRRESIEEIESGNYRPRPGRRPFRAERGGRRKDVIVADVGGKSVRRYVCQEADCGK